MNHSRAAVPNLAGKIARGLIYATALVPVVVVPGFFFPFVTSRAIFFRVLVELATAILLYLIVRREVAFHFRRDVVFWALSAWVAANTVAAAFGVAPLRSIFGDHERMGGVWLWVHLLAYYVLLRVFLWPDHWRRFLRVTVAVATMIASYGLVQEWFQPYNWSIGGISAGVTIGNSGLLAAYLLANATFCLLLAAHGGRRSRIVFLALGFLLLLAVVFTGNRSSTLALLVGGGSALVAYSYWSGSWRGPRAVAIAALFSLGLLLPFVARTEWARPVASRIPAIDRLSSGVDSSRVIQWRAAIAGIRERPLFGVGPENYHVVWSRYHHPEMYRFSGDSRWDRAHNAYLDAFATAGILGFLSLLAVCFALGWLSHRAARRSRGRSDETERPESGAAEAIALGFFVAYAFYLFFWFFDLNSTMFWIALAAFVASRAVGSPLIMIGALREKRWQSSVVLGLGAVTLVAVLYVHGFETLRMARTIDHLRDPRRAPAELLRDYQSVFDSPAPVTQHIFQMYASHLASLRPHFEQIRSDPASAAHFDRAFILAIEEFERQAVRDPLNERLVLQHARVLILGAYYYNNTRLYESALRRLREAVGLAPRRVLTHLALGVAYLNVQRRSEALEVFRHAYALYPPLGQTQAYLALAHAALGENRQAGRWLAGAMESGYSPDRLLVIRVASALADAGDPTAGADIAKLYLSKKIGPPFTWRHHDGAASAADYELAVIAAELYGRDGDSSSSAVITSALDALCSRPVPLDVINAAFPEDPSSQPPDCRQPWRTPGSRLLLNSPR